MFYSFRKYQVGEYQHPHRSLMMLWIGIYFFILINYRKKVSRETDQNNILVSSKIAVLSGMKPDIFSGETHSIR